MKRSVFGLILNSAWLGFWVFIISQGGLEWWRVGGVAAAIVGIALCSGGIYGHRKDKADHRRGGAIAYASLNAPAPAARPKVVSSDEVVRGWRVFSVQPSAEWTPLLIGQRGHRWETNTLAAECVERPSAMSVMVNFSTGKVTPRKSSSDLQRIEDPAERVEQHILNHVNDCGCGIYMRRDREGVYDECATAECVAWGAIVEGENGLRCQHVRIERIFTNYPPHVRAMLAERYQVPVEENDTGRMAQRTTP